MSDPAMTATAADLGVTQPSRPADDGIHARAVAAALRCVARHGLGKTTLDDVAREAGCSRATLYRYLGGKQELFATALGAEVDRIAARVREAVDGATTLEDAVVEAYLTTGLELHEHPALSFVAAHEPERLLPHLTFSGGDAFLARASFALAPALERFVGDRAERAAEWVARVGLTLWLCPNGPVSLTDPDTLRDYVRTYLLPAIDPEFSSLSRG